MRLNSIVRLEITHDDPSRRIIHNEWGGFGQAIGLPLL